MLLHIGFLFFLLNYNLLHPPCASHVLSDNLLQENSEDFVCRKTGRHAQSWDNLGNEFMAIL